MGKPVRVLHFLIGGPDYSGVASFLYQYYLKIDHNRVHFDFVFCRQNSMKLVKDESVFDDSEFYELDAVNRDNSVNLKLFDERFSKLLKEIPVDILQINTYVGVFNLHCATIARRCNVRTVISHSHNTSPFNENRNLPNILRDLFQRCCGTIASRKCDYLFACSESAGMSLFGKKGIKQDNFRVIPNAIDTSKYTFDQGLRTKIRRTLNVSDDMFVLGQIGRLSSSKNHMFTLDVFAEIIKRRPDSELWIIGEGDNKSELIEKATFLNLSKYIKFLGERNDVPVLLQGMDVMLFPSLWEGLGIVAIEGQAAGLPVYASDSIPRETQLTDLIHYLPLEWPPSKWAEKIINDYSKNTRRDTHQEIINHRYDIESSAKWLEDFYSKANNLQ